MKLCNYGCGQEAKYQFKNGKWCCSKSSNSCKYFRKQLSQSHKGLMSGEKHPLYGKKHSIESKEKMSESHKGLMSGEKHPLYNKHPSKESIEKMRLKNLGKIPWNKGLKTGPLSEETKIKMSNANKGKKLSNDQCEKIRQRMLNGGAKHAASFIKQETNEKCRQRMLNGQSLKMIKAIKKISNEEIKLRNLVKELYPHCEFQYPVFNYSLDVAIPDYKIAIEYDGYYHFDTEEHKEYHKFRQEKIESEGWKFLRYTMFDKFPDKNQIQKDIQETIK